MERTYNIPLRKHFRKTPRWRKTKKAVSGVQQFLKKHMKVETVKLGSKLNEELWSKGGKNPPHHVKVDVISDEGIAKAELSGHKYTDKTDLKKEAEKKEVKEEKKEIKPEKKTEEKTKEKKEVPTKKEAVKETTEKKETPKKEQPKKESKEKITS